MPIASFDAINKVLTIKINAGVTTAAAIIAAVGTTDNPKMENHFTAQLDYEYLQVDQNHNY